MMVLGIIKHFNGALDSDGMHTALMRVWDDHREQLSRRAVYLPHGFMICVPDALAREAFAIVKRFFGTALAKLPA
jgi:hypothetical protein